MNAPIRGVYLITNTQINQRFTHAELAKQAVDAGVRLIQYRDKQATGKEALAEIRQMAAHTEKTDTYCIVNDRVDLAMAAGADGVHLGQDDLPAVPAREMMGAGKIIGRSTSSIEEAKQAEEDGVDYVALGHIFETKTKKKEYAPRGLDTLEEVCQSVSVPVVAIGGITLENAPEVLNAGADCIAVCSAICRAESPNRAARAFVDLFEH